MKLRLYRAILHAACRRLKSHACEHVATCPITLSDQIINTNMNNIQFYNAHMYINLNELDWLRFGKIRLQEFCYYILNEYFVYYILLLRSNLGPQINLSLTPKKPWNGPERIVL
jgi:hypothetical protein